MVLYLNNKLPSNINNDLDSVVYNIEDFTFSEEIEKKLDEYEEIIDREDEIIDQNDEETQDEETQDEETQDEETQDEETQDEDILLSPLLDTKLDEITKFFEENYMTIIEYTLVAVEGLDIISSIDELIDDYYDIDNVQRKKQGLPERKRPKGLLKGKFKNNKFNKMLESITTNLNENIGISAKLQRITHITKKITASLAKISTKLKTSKLAQVADAANAGVKRGIQAGSEGLKASAKIMAQVLEELSKLSGKIIGTTLEVTINITATTVQKIAKLASSSKFAGKAKGVGKMADGLGTALGKVSGQLASGATKGAGKIAGLIGDVGGTIAKGISKLPLGPIAMIGGAALCFAAANSSEGALANEYADNEDAVIGANIACGIELALDLIVEAVKYAASAAGASAAMGTASMALGVFAIAFVAFQLATMIVDMVDPCGYNRPIFNNQMLDEFQTSYIYNMMKSINDTIESKAPEIRSNLVNEIIKVINENIEDETKHVTNERMNEIINSEFLQRKYMNGKTIKDVLGLTLDEYIVNQIRNTILLEKYPKPEEFLKGNSMMGKFKDEDLVDYLNFVDEYYETCDLVENPVSIEEMREAYFYRQKQLYGNYIFANIISVSAQNMEATQTQQLDALQRMQDFTDTLSSITRLIFKQLDAYNNVVKEYNRKKFQNTNEVQEKMFEYYIDNIINVLSHSPYNKDINSIINNIITKFDLSDEDATEIITLIQMISNEKREQRKFVIEEIRNIIYTRKAIKQAIRNKKLQKEKNAKQSIIAFGGITLAYVGYETYNIITSE